MSYLSDRFVDDKKVVRLFEELKRTLAEAGGTPYSSKYDLFDEKAIDLLIILGLNNIGFYYKKKYVLTDTTGGHDVEEFYKDGE